MNDNRQHSLGVLTTRDRTDNVLRTLMFFPGMKKLSIKDRFILHCRTPPIYPFSFIYKKGCEGMAAFLRNPRSKLETLELHDVEFDNRGAAVFAAGLVRNRTLKNLNISDAHGSITDVGWRAIFDALHASNFKLESLYLCENDLKDASADSHCQMPYCTTTPP